MGSATSVATGSAQPALECGDKIACPAVPYSAVHVLRDGIVTAIQTTKCGANMTAVLVRAVKLISGIFRDASHTAFCMGRSVNQDVMLADLDVLSPDDHCCMEHACQYARQAAAATAAAQYARNDPCSPESDVKLPVAPDYMGAAAWNGLHTGDGGYSLARTCHDVPCVYPEAALTHTGPVVVGVSERATCKDITSGIIALALVRRGLRQPTHGLHGPPRETAQH